MAHSSEAHISQLKSRLTFKRNRFEKMVDLLTEQFGSAWFLIFNAVFFVGWIEWNLGVFGFPMFDPFPFSFLTMIVSLEAIFLSVFVLISQNRQSKIADVRQQVDMEIDMRAEQEITKVLRMLDEIRSRIIQEEKDVELLEMEHDIDIATIQAEIERNSDF